MIYLLKMVILYSYVMGYVKIPEGNYRHGLEVLLDADGAGHFSFHQGTRVGRGVKCKNRQERGKYFPINLGFSEDFGGC